MENASVPKKNISIKMRFKRLFEPKIVQWFIPVALIILWSIFSQTGMLKANFFPKINQVVKVTWLLLQRGLLLKYIWVSAWRAWMGFFFGGSIGFVLGVLNGLSKPFDSLLDTFLQMFRTIPSLALMPLIILWFGIGENAKILMVAIATFFPLYINTRHGIRTIDKGLIEMGQVYGLKGFQLFRHVIFPGATSSILVGVRYALGSMWLILIAAETLATDAGIGYMATNARELLQMDIVVLSIVLYALLGKCSDSIAKFLEHRLLRWNPEFRKP
jgi:sulfonate transport system permease protein